MSKKLVQKALNEANVIADLLLDISSKQNDQIYWDCYEPGRGWHQNFSIYNGTTGILIFFLHLYELTNEEKYKQVLDDGVSLLIKSNDLMSNDNSLYLGRAGIIYFLSKYYFLNQKEEIKNVILKKSLELCASISPTNSSELFKGNTGIILALFEANNVLGDKEIKRCINEGINNLIRKIRFSDKGIYFDENYNGPRPLIGLSHGTSGLVLLFSELAIKFNKPLFHWITKNLMIYEDQYLDSKNYNWLDHRRVVDDKTFENIKGEYISGDLKSYKNERFGFSWCHGAPGVVLSRVRYLSHCNDTQSLRKLAKSLSDPFNDGITNLSATMCCGLGGVVYSMVELNKYLKDDSIEQKINDCLENFLQEKNRGNGYQSGWPTLKSVEEPSLFKGIAGIGLTYIRYCNSDFASIVNPTLNYQVTSTNFEFDFPYELEDILGINFPHSSKHILANDCVQGFDIDLLFKNVLDRNITDDEAKSFHLDWQKIKVYNQIDFVLLRVLNTLSQELFTQFKKQTSKEIGEVELLMSPSLFFHDEKIFQYDENGRLLNYDDGDGIYSRILTSFRYRKSINLFLKESHSMFENAEQMRFLLMDIITNCLNHNLLLVQPKGVPNDFFDNNISTTKPTLETLT